MPPLTPPWHAPGQLFVRLGVLTPPCFCYTSLLIFNICDSGPPWKSRKSSIFALRISWNAHFQNHDFCMFPKRHQKTTFFAKVKYWKSTRFYKQNRAVGCPKITSKILIWGIKKTRCSEMLQNGIVKINQGFTLKSPQGFAKIRLQKTAKSHRERKGPVRLPKRARLTKHQCA